MEVHRCRFVEWVPDEVQSLSISPDGSLLACGRRHGDIDVWSTKTWLPLYKISGAVEGSARAVAWAPAEEHDGSTPKRARRAEAALPRLLSAGLDGIVNEWSLATLSRVRWAASSGGAVLALSTSHDGCTLAAACEDGSVKLFRLKNETTAESGLTFARSLPRASGPATGGASRLLCVAWGAQDATVVAAGENGAIVGWDVASGATLFSIASSLKSSVPVLIWSLALLPDGTIVTGDSQGKTQFWSGTTHTLLQATKEHQADVLAVAASADGSSVFSAGVDSKLAMFRVTRDKSGREAWVVVGATRRHTHDVTALALRGDTLVSGSVDTQMIAYSVRGYTGDEGTKRVAPFQLARGAVSVAPRAGLLLAHYRRSLHVWRLGAARDPKAPLRTIPSGADLEIATPHLHVLELNLNAAVTSLACSAISSGGKYIACSDREQARVFACSVAPEGRVSLTKLRLPEQLRAALLVAFTPDESRLCAATFEGNLVVVRLGKGEPAVEAELPLSEGKGPRSPATHMCISGSNDIVAVADANGEVGVWSMRREGASRRSTLASLGMPWAAMAFTANSQSLVLATAERRLYVWSLESGQLSEWGRSASDTVLPGVALGMCVSPTDAKSVYVYSDKFLCRAPVVGTDPDEPREQLEAITRYQPTLFAGFTDKGALVVVERPWVQVLQHLPPPFNRTRFGQ
eukprot:m51a1_g9159 putative small nucleolar ribonucleoprotein complex (690) ;mRNA; f:134894-137354